MRHYAIPRELLAYLDSCAQAMVYSAQCVPALDLTCFREYFKNPRGAGAVEAFLRNRVRHYSSQRFNIKHIQPYLRPVDGDARDEADATMYLALCSHRLRGTSIVSLGGIERLYRLGPNSRGLDEVEPPPHELVARRRRQLRRVPRHP